MGWFSKDSEGDADTPTPPNDPSSPQAPTAEAPAGSSESPDVASGDDGRSSLAGLFSRPTDAAQPTATPGTAEAPSVFSESVDIEGSLEGEGDLLLRGRVRGSIHISGSLVVESSGTVHADVTAREVVNSGTVEGNITASERVRVGATGVVQGDIESPSIVIDDGGGVEGFVQMEPPGGEPEDDVDAAAPRVTPPPAAEPAPRTEPAVEPDPDPGPSSGDGGNGGDGPAAGLFHRPRGNGGDQAPEPPAPAAPDPPMSPAPPETGADGADDAPFGA